MSTPSGELKESEQFGKVEALLKKQQVLPLPEGEGVYVHKTKLSTKNSMLVIGHGNGCNIYELIHLEVKGERTGKVILGAGKDAVVREAVNLKNGQHVAVKLYPMYKKQSCPREFQTTFLRGELQSWLRSQKVNALLPKTFVELQDLCIAGDKSTEITPEHRILYVITEKHDQTLEHLMKNREVPLNTIIKALANTLIKHKELIQKGYIYVDANFCNVLLDGNLEPIFCDPEALLAPSTIDFFSYNESHNGKSGVIYRFSVIPNKIFHIQTGIKRRGVL